MEKPSKKIDRADLVAFLRSEAKAYVLMRDACIQQYGDYENAAANDLHARANDLLADMFEAGEVP